MSPATTVPISGGRIGVLLVNLGTPEAPTPAAVRKYLAEFLSDPRVVERKKYGRAKARRSFQFSKR